MNSAKGGTVKSVPSALVTVCSGVLEWDSRASMLLSLSAILFAGSTMKTGSLSSSDLFSVPIREKT